MNKRSSITAQGSPCLRLGQDGRTLTVRVAISFRRQGGRKQVLTPANTAPWTSPARVDGTLVKAIVRAHRWRDMLEAGRYTTLRDLAKAEKINESYLARVLRLTLLSSKVTEAILAGRQREELELSEFLRPFPIEWHEQEQVFLPAT